MDKTDVLILHKLSESSDVSASDLSGIVCLSVPAINKRIARLKEEGTIRKTTIITEPEDKLLQIKSIGGIRTMMCLREYKFEAASLPADPERSSK